MGDTWMFDTKQQADDFISQAEAAAAAWKAAESVPVIGIVDGIAQEVTGNN